MNLYLKQLNPHACRTYLIGREGSDDVVIVDPVVDHVRDYLDLLTDNGLTLSAVIDTHTHADHISGGASLKDATDCEYIMHEHAPAECVDRRLGDSDELRLLDAVTVKVIHTPGHTKDSVSLVFPDWVLTGDALFLDDGGAGRDDLPGGDPGAHFDSLERFRNLPGGLVVYPAHEYRDREPSSLDRQKETNPHLKITSRDEFITYLEDLKLGPADWMADVLKANYACAQDPNAAWIPADSPACEVKGTMDAGVNGIEVGPVTAAELKDELEQNGAPVLLDVREEEELEGALGHIDGIVHIPVWDLSHRLGDLDGYRKRKIVTVCRSGARAHTAAQIIKKAGFPHVRVLEGGMIAWNRT